MDTHGYSSGSIATLATTTQTQTIPTERIAAKAGIIALNIIMTVVQFQHLTRIVVYVNGKPKLDMTPEEFRQYLQRFFKRFNSTAYPADAATSWTIPFYAGELDEGDPLKYAQQLEPGDVSIELGINNTPGAGTLRAEWDTTNTPAQSFLEISRQGIGIGASSEEEKIFTQQGLLKGFSLNTTGLTELELDYDKNAGVGNPDWKRLIEATGAGLVERQRLEDGSFDTDPIATKILTPVPCRLRIRLTTAAGWAGTSNALVLYRLRPVEQNGKAAA